MVGCEIKTGQEIGPQDGLADVGYDEGKVENAVSDADLTIAKAVAGNFRPVCCM